MQDTKPTRAQRRAAQSNGKPKFKSSIGRRNSSLPRIAQFQSRELQQLHAQIGAPSRATRFAGIT